MNIKINNLYKDRRESMNEKIKKNNNKLKLKINKLINNKKNK